MRRVLAYLTAVLLMLTMLTACGGAGSVTSSAVSMDAASAGESYEMAPEEPAESAFLSSAAGGSLQTEDRSEKLIYTADLEMETVSFDEATAAIEALAENCGGYFESSSVSSWNSGYRHARYSIRVPAEQYKAFLDQAGQLCHVLDKQEYTDNVTEAYYDIAGRLKTQETKLGRLQELLAKAETMQDIITIESAISETEAQIEALSGQLQHYDALVDYSTVNISLSEVYRLSNVEEPATGFASRLGTAFASGWKNFVSGMESLAIALAYGWMWLLILAVIAVLAARRLRKRWRDRQAPAAKEMDDKRK